MKIEPNKKAKRPNYAAALAVLSAAALLTGCQNQNDVQIAGLISVVEDEAAPAVQAAPAE